MNDTEVKNHIHQVFMFNEIHTFNLDVDEDIS